MRSGYKETELGVIPEDWDALPLGNLVKLQGGYSFRSENFSEIGVPVIRISDIQEGGVAAEGAICHPPTRIANDFVVHNGDFLVAMSGATTSKVGVFRDQVPAYQNQRVGRFVVRDKTRTSQDYVGHLVRSHSFGSQLSVLLEQGAQPNVSARQIESLMFPVPRSLDEQRAIAEALSDVDELLGGLDRLIAKNRDLKQAAMQQLLTCQTRLPGFHGEWEIVRLSEVTSAPIQNGVFNEPSRKGRGCKLVNVSDLYSSPPINMQSLELFDADTTEIARFGITHGDVFFTRSSLTPEGIAHCNIYERRDNENAVFDCHIIRVRPNANRIYPCFLFRYCTAYDARQYFVANAKTTTMTTIDQSVIANLPIRLPILPEQIAIADVLTDMDAELWALAQRREKTHDLKQAMMQELVTGKTRLV